MKQLDLFLDTNHEFYDELFRELEPESRGVAKETLIQWRADELKLPHETYNKWIKKEYKN